MTIIVLLLYEIATTSTYKAITNKPSTYTTAL